MLAFQLVAARLEATANPKKRCNCSLGLMTKKSMMDFLLFLAIRLTILSATLEAV